ncbi:hypothetical protein PSI9734_02187 [Pseudidiomarina piscicola]|uniref:DUF4136 domain-containing protein n=1 Tax=Pseudidiomarina piscicola TaxID=2614830 RepID=A0A6S6WPV8_9GAMM|nr:hypothetical protein [Pseudidiomarina piscicola]CAB0151827.1 hypothetical protein PSI9734_02187 [Pseudidiomarina piscicola]VZT41273.1 hypothetical protein PSI9734_02187 [Pseudomonas aeruginosa]
MKTLLLVISLVMLNGCATIGMMPTDASEVDFDAVEGKTGWSEYQHAETFYGYSPEQVYEAAKVGLGNAGFSLRKVDKIKGVVIGEHGMTAHDWNVLAGVYFRSLNGKDTQVRVLVEGSKDIGFSGDVTSDGWSGKILSGLRTYLNDTYQAVLKVDKDDIK